MSTEFLLAKAAEKDSRILELEMRLYEVVQREQSLLKQLDTLYIEKNREREDKLILQCRVDSLEAELSEYTDGTGLTYITQDEATAISSYGGADRLSTPLYEGLSTPPYEGLSTPPYEGLSTALHEGLSTAISSPYERTQSAEVSPTDLLKTSSLVEEESRNQYKHSNYWPRRMSMEDEEEMNMWASPKKCSNWISTCDND
jgi:hypothetical protein